MSKTRPPYPAAFRQQMVELVRSGRTPGELAREFEPSSQAIRTWVAQAARDGGERSDGLRTEEREEIRRLRREVRRLREERDILTPPYMSRSVSGNSSSARHPSEPPSAKLPWLIAHTDDGRTSQPVPAAPPVSVRTDRGVTVSARGSDGRVQSAAPLSSFASDRDRFHSRVERDMPHGGGMVTLPVRDTRADDDPSSRGRPSKPGKFVACSDSGTDTRAPVWYKCSLNNHLRHHGGPCVTTDTVPQTVLFPDLFDKPLFARFNQEQASSDGGAILLKAAERIYGLVKAFAGCLFDKRAPDKTRHSLADLIGQRIFGIACGHPDCNDGDRLADDPIHKLLLDRDPVSGERLASQPTLSRFENAVNGCALYRMADELATRVIARHRRRLDGRARCITIDLDPTDDPTHGAQQYTLFNGYYDNWCYLPLLGFLTFDRESEQYLCAALLRHGKAVASEGTVGLLSRLLPRLRRAFPRARILVRLDGGFASPAVFAFLEAQPRLDYVIAMAKNAVLERYAEPAMLVARARARTWRSEQTEHVYTETNEYQAGTWNHTRRVVIKAEVVRHRDREPRDNPRFVVTNMRQTPRFLYEKVYCARGDAENRIKELKALQIDRTSCQTFSANQLRVLLTAAAYVLMQELRLRAADTACARAQVPWLRDRLLKLGVQVVCSVRRIVLRLPRATPDLAAWRHIAFALGARAG